MQHDIYIYLLLMSAVTLAIRIVPLTLIRGQIKNGFLRSFLFYTQTPVSGARALGFGIGLAWYGASLFKVASVCCFVVFLSELALL